MDTFKFILIFFTCICTYCCSENQPIPNDGLPNTIGNTPGNENPGSTDVDIDGTEDLLNTDFNILFIGNSLTYTNDLPELVKKRGEQKGITIGTKMIAFPNYAIIDYWSDGEVQKQITSKKYQFVIIQQGPSSQPYGRQILIEYGKKYNDLCKLNDTKLCYFMVWPSLTYYQTFEGVINNHREAASINDAILCPVGKVWKEHFDSTNTFDYYGPDGFHPSLKGSQVAANVIIDTLFP